MSFYATIQGEIIYPKKEQLLEAVEMLTKDGWLKNNRFVDEGGTPISDDEISDVKIFPPNFTLSIPFACYRNLARVLDVITKDTIGKVIWVSTDGCFEGGTFENGKEVAYDLTEYAKKNGIPPPADEPVTDEDWQRYADWQVEVEEWFFGL